MAVKIWFGLGDVEVAQTKRQFLRGELIKEVIRPRLQLLIHSHRWHNFLFGFLTHARM